MDRRRREGRVPVDAAWSLPSNCQALTGYHKPVPGIGRTAPRAPSRPICAPDDLTAPLPRPWIWGVAGATGTAGRRLLHRVPLPRPSVLRHATDRRAGRWTTMGKVVVGAPRRRPAIDYNNRRRPAGAGVAQPGQRR